MSFYGYYLMRHKPREGKIGLYASLTVGRVCLDPRMKFKIILVDGADYPPAKTDAEMGFMKVYEGGIKILRKIYK